MHKLVVEFRESTHDAQSTSTYARYWNEEAVARKIALPRQTFKYLNKLWVTSRWSACKANATNCLSLWTANVMSSVIQWNIRDDQ